jgi:cell wall-associated NlpC family hydrolase
MRPLRYLILLLVLASALLMALVQPLPGVADGATGTKKHTRKHSHKHHLRRRHHHVAAHSRPALGTRVVKYARRFVGVPYVWGGSSPRSGFDCSGFVRYVWGHFGISLPHSSYGDMSRGRSIGRKYLRPGDLVFFAGGSHVGIFIGRNRVIDAPYSGAVVHITTMTDWYSSAYDGARRIARVAA